MQRVVADEIDPTDNTANLALIPAHAMVADKQMIKSLAGNFFPTPQRLEHNSPTTVTNRYCLGGCGGASTGHTQPLFPRKFREFAHVEGKRVQRVVADTALTPVCRTRNCAFRPGSKSPAAAVLKASCNIHCRCPETAQSLLNTVDGQYVIYDYSFICIVLQAFHYGQRKKNFFWGEVKNIYQWL